MLLLLATLTLLRQEAASETHYSMEALMLLPGVIE